MKPEDGDPVLPFPTPEAFDRWLHRRMTAKQAATRARRITTFVTMLADGETLHPRPAPRARSQPSGRRSCARSGAR